jgi:hypothetical protein
MDFENGRGGDNAYPTTEADPNAEDEASNEGDVAGMEDESSDKGDVATMDVAPSATPAAIAGVNGVS